VDSARESPYSTFLKTGTVRDSISCGKKQMRRRPFPVRQKAWTFTVGLIGNSAVAPYNSTRIDSRVICKFPVDTVMAFGVQVGSPNTADTLPLAFEIILDQRAETTVLIPEVWVFRIRIAAACRGWQKGIPIRIMNHFAPDFGQFAVGHSLLSAQSGHRDQTAAHAVRPWPVRGRKYWSTRANSHTDRSRTDPS